MQTHIQFKTTLSNFATWLKMQTLQNVQMGTSSYSNCDLQMLWAIRLKGMSNSKDISNSRQSNVFLLLIFTLLRLNWYEAFWCIEWVHNWSRTFSLFHVFSLKNPPLFLISVSLLQLKLNSSQKFSIDLEQRSTCKCLRCSSWSVTDHYWSILRF